MAKRPGMNDVLPCGTRSAKRRHLAKGEQCWFCGVPEWPGEPEPASERKEARQP